MSGRILITGASGFIGRHVRRAIEERGEGARVVGVDLLPGDIVADIRDDAALARLPPVEVIIHCAALAKEPGSLPREYMRTNHGGTQALLRLAQTRGIRHFVFLSSMSVYGATESPCDEEAPHDPDTFYGASKALAETVLRDWQRQEAGRHLAILRPGVVFGPGEGGNFDRLVRTVRRGVFVFPGRRDARKACIYVRDVVGAVLHCLDAPRPVYVQNLAYDTRRLDEVVAAIGRTLGRRVVTPSVPETAIRAAFRVASLAEFGRPDHLRTFHPRRIDKVISSTNMISGKAGPAPYPLGWDLEGALREWLGAP
jgi:nucleoside-diphosphate-sugar epimerase